MLQGDYNRETVYSGDPLAIAQRWYGLGASRLHVVDLDGARSGKPQNSGVIARICQTVPVEVEVSGGMRTLADIEAAFGYGATRVQLGSAAVDSAAIVHAAVHAHPGAIVVSIDAKDGEVRTGGWLEGSGLGALELAQRMADAGVPRIMFTDIGRDGMLAEPNFEALSRLVQALPIPVIASGGVASIQHLIHLAQIGCEGAIVGKALYEGTVELAAALAAAASLAPAAPPC